MKTFHIIKNRNNKKLFDFDTQEAIEGKLLLWEPRGCSMWGYKTTITENKKGAPKKYNMLLEIKLTEKGETPTKEGLFSGLVRKWKIRNIDSSERHEVTDKIKKLMREDRE